MPETPLASGAMPHSDFESQYRRIFEATRCRTQVELAELLGIRQSSISDAKRRKTIPAEWLLKIFDKKRIPPDWNGRQGGCCITRHWAGAACRYQN